MSEMQKIEDLASYAQSLSTPETITAEAITASKEKPYNPNPGDMWFNTDTGTVHVCLNGGAEPVWVDTLYGAK